MAMTQHDTLCLGLEALGQARATRAQYPRAGRISTISGCTPELINVLTDIQASDPGAADEIEGQSHLAIIIDV